MHFSRAKAAEKMVVGKGTPAFGQRNDKSHTLCRRCGKRSYHIQKKKCASCGFPSARVRHCKFSSTLQPQLSQSRALLFSFAFLLRTSCNLISRHALILYFSALLHFLTLRCRQLGKEGSGSPHHRHRTCLYAIPFVPSIICLLLAASFSFIVFAVYVSVNA